MKTFAEHVISAGHNLHDALSQLKLVELPHGKSFAAATARVIMAEQLIDASLIELHKGLEQLEVPRDTMLCKKQQQNLRIKD